MTARLFIGNVFDPEYLQVDGGTIAARIGHLAKRMLWFARPSDSLLLQVMPSTALLQHVREVRGVDLSSSQIFISEHESAISGKDIEHAIASIGDDAIELFPWYPSGPIAKLARQAGTELHYGLAQETVNSGLVIDLNSKVQFRDFASELGLPIPNGFFIPSGKLPAAPQLESLVRKTGAVIIKADLGAGAVANEILTTNSFEHALPGGRTTRTITDHTLRSTLESIVSDGKNYVVEEYHRNRRSVFAEFIITAGQIELVCYGQQRFSGLWNGFEIGSQVFDDEALIEQFLSFSRTAACAVQKKGARGHISLDAVISDDDVLFFNELNYRVQGCTHISFLLRELTGPGYQTDLAVLTRNGVKCADFVTLIGRLQAAGIQFSQESLEGVILCNDCVQANRTIEYLVCGPTLQKAHDIEGRLNELLRSCAA